MQERDFYPPRVSIVVPVRDDGDVLARTLDSVLAQSFRDFEVLILDDATCGAALGHLQSDVLEDPRVRVLRGDYGSVAAAVNAGIGEAAGAYIAVARAGDVWLPEKLARQVSVLDSSGPSVGLVYTWSAEVDETGTMTGRFTAAEERGDVYTRLVYEDFIGGPSAVLIRRSCLQRVGGWECELHGAVARPRAAFSEFLLRVAELYGFEVVPEVLVRRQREGADCVSLDAERRLLRRVGARHPRLPGRLFRWAMGRRFVELSERCEAAGDDARAGWYLLCAAMQDAGLLASGEFRTVLGRHGGRVAERLLGRRKASSPEPLGTTVTAPAATAQRPGIVEHPALLEGWRRARLQAARGLSAHGERRPPFDAQPAAPVRQQPLGPSC